MLRIRLFQPTLSAPPRTQRLVPAAVDDELKQQTSGAPEEGAGWSGGMDMGWPVVGMDTTAYISSSLISLTALKSASSMSKRFM